MRKLIPFILLFLAVSVEAQTDSDDAQPSPDQMMSRQFASFGRLNVQEKLFVHTDKDFYVAGEIVWYKIYYMDGSFHRPFDLSKLAYVEILDQNNRPVMQGKNALLNSTGKGSFYLPSSINSGSFKLRAYTNWMKNTDADYFFEKSVRIINPFRPLNLPAVDPPKKYEFRLFPEGGNLVTGLESRVAVKISDEFGTGLNCSGAIIDDNNDTIARFTTLKFGMGSFVMTPTVGRTYKAVIAADSISMTEPLPLVKQAGYSMRVVNENDSYKVMVTTNLMELSNGGEVYMLAHTRQNLKQSEKKSFVNGTATFTIAKNKLGDGISQITIFNRDQQPLAERLVFKAPAATLRLNAATGAGSFTTRNNVEVNIGSTLENKPVAADLSLAVYRVDSLTSGTPVNMAAYLLLTADIRGYIEAPEFYLSNDPQAIEASDNLMLTQGWRRFNWSQAMRKNPAPKNYAPEFDGHLVAATITYNQGQQPVSGAKAYLSVPGNKTQFYTSVTNKEGKAFFDIRDYFGKNEVVVQSEPLADSNYRIELTDPFFDRYSVRPFARFNIERTQSSEIVNHSVSVQTLNAYLNDSISKFDIPILDSNPFYGKYSKRYLLDDYVRFVTMEEVLREYVPEIGIKRTGGQPRLRISDWDQLKYLDGEPLLLLDGVPVTHKQILAYDPMKVRKLEVVTNRYISGKFVFDGIASFNTYTGTIPDFQYDPKTVIVDYEGLQLEREFYSPVYINDEQRSSRLPDFRETLTWQPDLKTAADGKASARFFTSDRAGKYVGVIYGIDANGNAASQTFTFDVTK